MGSISFTDLMGMAGVVCIVSCYARLQWQRDFAKDILYSAGNLAGSLFVMASLLDKWNLAAFIINLIMGSISLYGVYRCLKYGAPQKAEAGEAAALQPEGE